MKFQSVLLQCGDPAVNGSRAINVQRSFRVIFRHPVRTIAGLDPHGINRRGVAEDSLGYLINAILANLVACHEPNAGLVVEGRDYRHTHCSLQIDHAYNLAYEEKKKTTSICL